MMIIDKETRSEMLKGMDFELSALLKSKNLSKEFVSTVLPAFILPVLFTDIVDSYIEHRIKTDKVLIGILKDIHGELARGNDLADSLSGGPVPKECM